MNHAIALLNEIRLQGEIRDLLFKEKPSAEIITAALAALANCMVMLGDAAWDDREKTVVAINSVINRALKNFSPPDKPEKPKKKK